MTKQNHYKNHFLIAMPALKNQTFGKSVIYLYEHNDEGAMGVIINKPMQIQLSNVLEHLNIPITDESIRGLPVFMGGPVGQEHGFVIHDSNVHNKNEITISASKEMLALIASGSGPDHFLVTLGYSGWGAGQLDVEIQRNDWLLAPFDPTLLFSTPIEKRWHAAAELIGVDMNQLSDQVGHA